MPREERVCIQEGKNQNDAFWRLMIIEFKHKGDFSKTNRYLEKALEAMRLDRLNHYGEKGVAALSAATPVDTGLTAQSWYYEIRKTSTGASIVFKNSNVNKGVNIAIILQYGHATRYGGWVEGRDYINPAIQPVFDEIAKDAWEEVRRI